MADKAFLCWASQKVIYSSWAFGEKGIPSVIGKTDEETATYNDNRNAIAATAHEIDLMNEHKWDEIFAEVTDEEMEMIFEYNKEGLERNDIHNAAELRQTIMLYSSISATMNGWHDAQLKSDKVMRDKGTLIEENIQDDSYYLAGREEVAKHWYSRIKADGKTSNTYILLYKKDGRWFSLNGLKLSVTIAEGIARHNKEEESE